MKNFKRAKTLQLAVMLALVVIMLVLIFSNADLYHVIANQLQLTKLVMIIWLLLVVCFGFLIYDFTVYQNLKRKYGEIDMALYSDPMTGIGNRSSLDAFIDEYAETELPAGIGSITFSLTHMGEINGKYGNKEGDRIIKEFSNILADCGKGRCFVGRNGGNQFLALFKDSTEEGMKSFIDDVIYQTEEFNDKVSENQSVIIFKYGEELHREAGAMTMNELVASSYKKAMHKHEDDCGAWQE